MTGEKILIVEDNPLILELITDILEPRLERFLLSGCLLWSVVTAMLQAKSRLQVKRPSALEPSQTVRLIRELDFPDNLHLPHGC